MFRAYVYRFLLFSHRLIYNMDTKIKPFFYPEVSSRFKRVNDDVNDKVSLWYQIKLKTNNIVRSNSDIIS